MAYIEFDYWGTSMTADEIIEIEERPQPIGILNADGHMIYRRRERIPFGFHPPARKFDGRS